MLRTDPTERMDIHTLMRTPLVTGEEEPHGVPIPGAEDEEIYEVLDLAFLGVETLSAAIQ